MAGGTRTESTPWWLDPALLTCDVCGDIRQEHQIAVRTVPLHGLGERFGTKRTLRYCNDRPGCCEAAKDADVSTASKLRRAG